MPNAFDRNVYCLLGTPFDAVSMDDTVRGIQAAAVRREPFLLATPNVNIVLDCLADDAHRNVVTQSDLIVVDGMPLVWIARLLGLPLRERVAGSTLIEALRSSQGKRLSVFFFGGPDGVADLACKRLASEAGGLTCAGFESPGFGSVEEMSTERMIERINTSGADFLVVALGAKKGHAWIDRNRARLKVPIVSHLGAVVNFVAGTVRRAPSWMQRMGLEWLWRIKEEPVLWRRYLREGLLLLSLFMTRVFPHFLYLLRNTVNPKELPAASIDTREESDLVIVRPRGEWCQANLEPMRACFSRAALAGKDVTLDMSGVTYVDSAMVGLVVLLQSHQRQQGKRLLITSVPRPVRRVIRFCCAEFLYQGVV